MESEKKIDLSNYFISGPFTDDEKIGDLSWNQVKDEKEYLALEEGFSVKDFETEYKKQEKQLYKVFGVVEYLTQDDPHYKRNTQYNAKKDRYSNIVPTQFKRVILQQEKGYENQETYINACYIDGCSKDRRDAYIATQGPLEETMWDFWRMVWQQDTQLIIMVSKLFDRGRPKCFQYYPDKKEQVYASKDFQLTLTNTQELAPKVFFRREFLLKNLVTKESRKVFQLMYSDWPDHGAMDLKAMEIMMTMITEMQKARKQAPKSKVVVHCSAGVGRTGTTLTCCLLTQQLQDWKAIHGNDFYKDPTFKISVFGVVRRLREQRTIMVQSYAQYQFIHQFMTYYLKNHIYDK